MRRLSVSNTGPLVRSMVPALLTATNWPGSNGSIECAPLPANTVLVGSTERVPVPVPKSPRVNVLENVSCDALVSSKSSQLT